MPGRGVRQRIWGTLIISQQPLPRSPTSGSAVSEPSCVEDQRMKCPGEKNHSEAAEADWSVRVGREATGPEEEEGPRPTPSLGRGIHTESSPEAKTTECGTLPASEQTGRPKDDKNSPPRTGWKNAPKSPTVVIPSLEIRSWDSDLKRVTPSWRNTDQLFKEDFVSIEWEKNPTRPVGWPHREPTKDWWMEEAFVPIECAEIRHTTRYGWPHREGSAPTSREGARRVFVPIEIWDKLDP